MLVGKQAVLDYIEMTGAKAWRLYNAKNKNIPTLTCAESSTQNGSVCKKTFADWADLAGQYQQSVEYYITVFPKGLPKKTAEVAEGESNASPRDTLSTAFFLYSPYGANAMNGVPQGYPMPQQPAIDIDAVLAKAKQEWNAERDRKEEIDELRAELRELKEGGGMGSLSGVVEMAKPYIPMILAKLGIIPGEMAAIASPTLNGPPVETQEEKDLDIIRRRIWTAINTISLTDPHICEHLETLAKMSTEKPAIFNGMLDMLNTMK